MNSSQPRRMSKDYAYFEIKNKILNGDFTPEESLIESKLAEELDISKTPLREALQKLEVEELVVRQANGRLKTPSITVQEAEEIFLVRSYLEGIIAKQATNHATQEDIDSLSGFCDKINQAIEMKNIEEILHYGTKFHEHLYRISGNRTVVKILSQLNDHVTRYRRLVPLNNEEMYIQDTDEHSIILQHIIEGDRLGAESTMRSHILSSMSVAIEAIKNMK